MTGRRYSDPAALRQALADRLRLLVRQRPGAQLADLQRQAGRLPVRAPADFLASLDEPRS